MEKILENLADPSWWFTGLFFVVLVKFAPRLFAAVKSLISNRAKQFLRGRRLKHVSFLRDNRHNLAAVNYQSTKSQAYFVMFLLTCSLYLIWFTAGPLYEILKASDGLFVICMAPLYTVQLFWLLQESRAKNLVAEYGKVRVTRH
jgi:hypothetical protein